MKLYKEKLTAKYGYFEGQVDSVDEETSSKAIDYKKTVIRNYISITQEQIESRLTGADFYVTKKYDGELNLIFFDEDNTFMLNRSGRVRLGLPCLEEACKALKSAGIKQAIIPSELYVDDSSARTRVFDVLEALANEQLIKNLRLAPFEIYEIDSAQPKTNSYIETYEKLTDIFGKTTMCKPVKMEKASSRSGVLEIYSQWVEKENIEGLVVRSNMPMVYKVKPRYTVDVVVIGFSEGVSDQKGQVRSLLLAMMDDNGKLQIIGRTGNGFDDELKKKLLGDLTPMIVESSYIETDSNHVAFHMIKPEIVIELMVNDVLFETSSGPIINHVLEFENNRYFRSNSVPGLSFVYPIFVRFRDDKTACKEDIRLSQVNNFAYIPQETVKKAKASSGSELIHREVYKKIAGEKLMVQKFLVWKTGKENDPAYPAYVFHYTNFSSDRKEPLQCDVFISEDKGQIMSLMEESLLTNIKKGWEKI